MPIVPIVKTADGEADCDCYQLSTEMPCLYIKVNYHIQSRHIEMIYESNWIMIIGPTRSQSYGLVSSKADIPPKLE